MDAKTAWSLVRSVCDNDRMGEWIEDGSPPFIWDGSNRFRVRDEDGEEHFVYGSGNLVECLVRGHSGPAIIQGVKLDLAADIRRRTR